ncbi:MAG: endonuclease domain-containing protein [Blastocatellia bacterium]
MIYGREWHGGRILALNRRERQAPETQPLKTKIRGLLCRHCNLALGNMKDDISLLRKAIAYLEKHQ